MLKVSARAAWNVLAFVPRQWKSLCAALALSLTAASADAGPRLVYETGDQPLFSMAIADNWMVNVGKETPAADMPEGAEPNPRVVSLIPSRPRTSLWIGVWSPVGVGTLEDAKTYLVGLEGRLLDTAKIEERRTLDIAGAPGFEFRGTGERREEPLEFSIAVLDLKGDRVAVFAFIGAPGEWNELQPALTSMLDSVRQIEGGNR